MLRPTQLKLTDTDRATITALMNQQLANLTDLRTQAKQAHWSVMGTGFFMLHRLFDELAELAAHDIDDLAERIATLGGVAHGTVRAAAKSSQLPDLSADERSGPKLVIALIERFAAAANSARKGIDMCDAHHDRVSADLLSAIVSRLDKGTWLLESSLGHDS